MHSKGSNKRKIVVMPTTTGAKRTNASHRLVENFTAVSQPEIVQLNYEYTIPDFSLLPQKTGEFVLSPPFFSTKHKHLEWQLVIFPYGADEDCKGYLSLFLEFKAVTEEKGSVVAIPAYLTLTVFKNGDEVGTDSFIRLFSSKKSHGWVKFLKLNDLKSNCSEENELKIFCSLVFDVKRNWIFNLERLNQLILYPFSPALINFYLFIGPQKMLAAEPISSRWSN